jgi:hypothetical protein
VSLTFFDDSPYKLRFTQMWFQYQKSMTAFNFIFESNKNVFLRNYVTLQMSSNLVQGRLHGAFFVTSLLDDKLFDADACDICV